MVLFPTAQCPDNKVLFDSTGVILSPGFPDSYSNVEMCSWLINVEKGYNITLFFELFQTEKEFDILEIFDGMLQPSRKNDVCVSDLLCKHTRMHTLMQTSFIFSVDSVKVNKKTGTTNRRHFKVCI